jgi:proteasome regulatory subunit
VEFLAFTRDGDVCESVELRVLREKVKVLSQVKASLERDLEYYRGELAKLLAPPYIEAVVLEVFDNGRVLVKSSSGPNLVVDVSSSVDRSKLRVGALVALNSRGSTIVEVLPSRYDPIAKLMVVEERPRVTFSDIGGLRDQIRELQEIVILPLKHPELLVEMGVEPPKGVLLYGPPGTGKTLLARAVAGEAGVTFISLVASELVNKYIGEGARLVREVFRLARSKAPSIVFIDEIDAIAARRLDVGTSGEREVQRTMLQLLAELDGFNPLERVKVIAATNRLDILDPALLRPGRFDRIIELQLPDTQARLEILRIHTRKTRLAGNVDLLEIAKLTEGFTGAHLKHLVVEAAYSAIRRNSKEITQEDLIEALNKLKKQRRGAITQLQSHI